VTSMVFLSGAGGKACDRDMPRYRFEQKEAAT
jgi:hypothetical protein